MIEKLTLIIFLLGSKALCQAVTINAPAALPSGSSQIVDHSFPSLACEVASFADYGGELLFAQREPNSNISRQCDTPQRTFKELGSKSLE